MKDSSSNLLTTLSFTMSALALLTSGFALYQTLSARQAIAPAVASGAVQPSTIPVSPANDSTKPPLDSASSPAPATAAPATAGIQPKQFVQPAFGSIGEVELLSVKRIQDPDTGKRDVVNVQFRVRRLSEDFPDALNNSINGAETTARNPETSETYEPVDYKSSTDPIVINLVPVNSSVDGYVWMRIPENVNTIDLFMKQTQAFKNVPIAN